MPDKGEEKLSAGGGKLSVTRKCAQLQVYSADPRGYEAKKALTLFVQTVFSLLENNLCNTSDKVYSAFFSFAQSMLKPN